MDRIILYDGVCGLCNRFVLFVLARDPSAQFRFASLQSDFAKKLLAQHGYDAERLDTVYLVTREATGDTVLAKSHAVLRVLNDLGGGWRSLATVLNVLPTFVLNLGYDFVARIRYRIFGKYPSCPMPEEDYRNRFL